MASDPTEVEGSGAWLGDVGPAGVPVSQAGQFWMSSAAHAPALPTPELPTPAAPACPPTPQRHVLGAGKGHKRGSYTRQREGAGDTDSLRGRARGPLCTPTDVVGVRLDEAGDAGKQVGLHHHAAAGAAGLLAGAAAGAEAWAGRGGRSGGGSGTATVGRAGMVLRCQALRCT